MEMVPYTEINGARTFSDLFLAQIFTRMAEQNLVAAIFSGILMRNASDFIQLMKTPSNIPVFVMDDGECIGFAWLNGIGRNHAYGHFCYFKNDKFSSIDFGKKVIDYWFSLSGQQGAVLDVILGAVPSFNEKASHYVQKLGFKRLGEIPKLHITVTGEKWASVIHYMERP